MSALCLLETRTAVVRATSVSGTSMRAIMNYKPLGFNGNLQARAGDRAIGASFQQREAVHRFSIQRTRFVKVNLQVLDQIQALGRRQLRADDAASGAVTEFVAGVQIAWFAGIQPESARRFLFRLGSIADLYGIEITRPTKNFLDRSSTGDSIS